MGFPIQIYQPGSKKGGPLPKLQLDPMSFQFYPIPNLVGGFTPLKNMTSSVGMMTFPTEWKIKHVPNHQPANCLLATFLDLLVWGPKVQHIQKIDSPVMVD